MSLVICFLHTHMMCDKPKTEREKKSIFSIGIMLTKEIMIVEAGHTRDVVFNNRHMSVNNLSLKIY